MNTISKLALVFIVVGAVVLAGPTFGFSTIAGDRGVSIATADDPTANLGIEAAYNDQTITSGDAQPLVRLTNNFAQTLGGGGGTIAVEVAEVSGDIQNNSALVVDSTPTQLGPGDGGNVDVICADNRINGKKTVNVTLRVIEVSGQTVSVANKAVNPVANVDVKCSDTDNTKSGLTDVWVSDLPVNRVNTNQTFDFTLTRELGQDDAVTIDLPNKVDYSTATVSIRDDDGNGTVEFTKNNNKQLQYVASNGPVSEDTPITIEITGIDTTGNNAAGTHDVTFQKDNESGEVIVQFTVG